MVREVYKIVPVIDKTLIMSRDWFFVVDTIKEAFMESLEGLRKLRIWQSRSSS
jgi:hypothetical protein